MSRGFLFRKDISIVPILGAIDEKKEETFRRILAPYLASEDTLFVIFSDFCHWGTVSRMPFISRNPLLDSLPNHVVSFHDFAARPFHFSHS